MKELKTETKNLKEKEVRKMRKVFTVLISTLFISSLAFAGVVVDGGKQSVDVYDISKGTQTNDVKVTLDSEEVTANLSATDNAVLDQIELNTDPLLVVGGGAEATAQRVTIANDSTGVVSVDDGGSALTVDGTVTAELSATDNAVLDVIETNTDSLTVVGGGAEATALRVTIANDSTGVVTVDGTITADLSATDNAVLDQIELNTDPLLVVGGGTEATAQRVTIANDSTGVITVDGAVTVDMGSDNDVVVDQTLVTKTSSQDLSAAPLAYTTNFAADTEVLQVLVHAASAITQTIKVTFDSTTGATYDTVLDSTDVTAATDYYWTPDSKFVIASGDEILVSCTDTASPAITVYVTVIGKTIN